MIDQGARYQLMAWGIPFVELREGAGSRDVPLKDEPGSGGDRRISINQAPVEQTT